MASEQTDPVPSPRQRALTVVISAAISGALLGGTLSSLAVLAWFWSIPRPEPGLEPSAAHIELNPSTPTHPAGRADQAASGPGEEGGAGEGSAMAPAPAPLAPDDPVLAGTPLVPGQLPDVEPLPVPEELQQPDTAAEPEALSSDRVVLRVHTLPSGAQISLDGRNRGRSPAKLMVNPGSYKLTLATGKAKRSFRVEASEDQRLCYEATGKKMEPVGCERVLQR